MALKKSELYASLWASCDELRGGMDASQYKDYVLVLLFVKYISDRYAGEPYAPIAIPKGASFADMVALKGQSDIGDQINKKILGPLAQANKLSDMPDFNDPNRRYLLKLVEAVRAPSVELSHSKIVLSVRPDTERARREEIVEQWLRAQMHEAVPPLVKKWERVMGVEVRDIFIQRMKTKWGSCNHHAGSIRLNTDLARKPRECLEYIVVHEMVHLLEPTHNDRFIALMNKFMPKWQSYRDLLNRLPVRHEDWNY
jgi:predicted metal-dependent hydrolase